MGLAGKAGNSSLFRHWRRIRRHLTPVRLGGNGPLVSLLHLARERIETLNGQYAGNGSDVFFLFHRPRRWNPHDRIWMGYERKRGKLADLTVLLREGNSDGFSLLVGATARNQHR